MADISKFLKAIKTAIYGEEVRGSIHDAIEAMNEESSAAYETAITAQDSAKNSAAAAKASETATKTSETNAKSSETKAKTSEINAKASETAAKTSEKNASDSANKAKEYLSKMVVKTTNHFDLNTVSYYDESAVVSISGLKQTSHYAMNFTPIQILGNTTSGQEEIPFYVTDNGAYITGSDMQYTDIIVYFSAESDPTEYMFVEVAPTGPYEVPEHFKPFGTEAYINDLYLASVYYEINRNKKETNNHLKDLSNLLIESYENILNPESIRYDGYNYAISVQVISEEAYCSNIPYTSILSVNYVDEGTLYKLNSDYYGYKDGGMWFKLPEGQIYATIIYNPIASPENIMVVKGNNLPKHFKPYGVKEYISDNLLESVYAEIGQQTITEILGHTSGAISLKNSMIYHLIAENNISFILPTNNDVKYGSQIIVQAIIDKPISIDWGTEYFYNGVIPNVPTGRYTITYEYDGVWSVKVEFKGPATTTSRSVKVDVTGEYNGVNHWENATYTFEVTNGVESEYGWLSNGYYKFMYYPATGQIKNAEQAASFALEDGKEIPDYIVNPYSIGEFTTGYNQYEAKNINVYAANSNYGIFRGVTIDGATVVVPEGVTAIEYNPTGQGVFGQNYSSNVTYVMPSTLTSIGGKAFEKSSISKLIFNSSTAPSIASGSFTKAIPYVGYPADGTGYDGTDFTGKFPSGTVFVEEASE